MFKLQPGGKDEREARGAGESEALGMEMKVPLPRGACLLFEIGNEASPTLSKPQPWILPQKPAPLPSPYMEVVHLQLVVQAKNLGVIPKSSPSLVSHVKSTSEFCRFTL